EILFIVAVAELKARPRGERPALVAVVPARARAVEPRVRAIHDGAGERKVRVRAAEDERRVAGHVDEAERAREERVALARARGAAVERLESVERDELGLLRVRLVRRPRRSTTARDAVEHRIGLGEQ